MRIITLYIALTLMTVMSLSAQTDNKAKDSTFVETLSTEKEHIIQEEKDALKREVEKINSNIENGSVSKEEAEELKRKAAQKHALNIENRIAIIENETALKERNSEQGSKVDNAHFLIGIGNENADRERIFGVSVKRKKRKVLYDRRTTSGAIIAFGLNNAITEGESLEDSDFKVAGSRFFEIGWVWKTRVLKNSNWFRVKYGFSFQFNGLKPTENRYFVDTGEQTELQIFPLDLKKSKFRMDNLVIPVHFEFGPSKKVDHTDYFRYDTRSQFKFGIGAYGGINLGVRQKLKFTEDGDKKKQKLKENYNSTNFVYGISSYVGWGASSIYFKYDLNPIFKNNTVEQRNISLGFRLDLD
ncbi:MAG TPA: hypothetical protein VKX34_06955 [Aequorivita sp.]|nr:hypothetical protein [Aequorivita sp.]